MSGAEELEKLRRAQDQREIKALKNGKLQRQGKGHGGGDGGLLGAVRKRMEEMLLLARTRRSEEHEIHCC